MKKILALFIAAVLMVSATFIFASATAETITVDGNLDDSGWADSRWVTVNSDDGSYQGEPTTSDKVSFKYQVRLDADKIYVAVIYTQDFAATPDDAVEGNGNGTNIRLWIHNGNSSAVTYTHFYDVYRRANGKTNTGAFYNTNPTGNAKAAIASSSIKAETSLVDGQYVAEFSIARSEFDGTKDFTYFLAVSSKLNENICLFYPKITIDPNGERLGNFPYRDWEDKTAGKANDDLLLGEIADETSEPVVDETSEPVVDETSEPVVDETSEPVVESAPEDETSAAPTGDNGVSTLLLAVIALVAVAGSAVVIRTRG